MTPRCVVLTGGHGAGKTTVFKAVEARHRTRPGWRWVHADGDVSGTARENFDKVVAWWEDPTIAGLALEGRYVYATLFRVALAAVRPRDLWIGLTLQAYEVGRAHIQQRCEKRGKRMSSWWDQEKEHAEYEFTSRYTRALDVFLTRNATRCLTQVKTFWIDAEYTVLPEVEAWLEEAVTAP